jgi:hypothetical protein
MADIDIPKVARSVEKVDERRSARSSALRKKRAKTLYCTRVVGHSLRAAPKIQYRLFRREGLVKIDQVEIAGNNPSSFA